MPAWTAGLLALAAAFWVHWSLHLLHLVAMAGLPWVLAATHLLITRPTPRRAAGLGAVLGLWWLQYVAAIALLIWLVPETREAFEAATGRGEKEER